MIWVYISFTNQENLLSKQSHVSSPMYPNQRSVD